MLGEAVQTLSAVALVVVWLTILYSGTRLALLLRNGMPLWFDTMFWAFSYIWIALAGFAQMTAGKNPYRLVLTEDSYLRAALLTLLGFVCFDLGKLLVRGRIGEVARLGRRRVAPTRVGILALLTVLAMPVLIQLLGGWRTLLVSRSERTETLAASGLLTESSKAAGGLLLAGTNSLALVSLLGLIAIVQAKPELRRRLVWILAIAIMGAICAFVGNPISNPRFWSGTILLSILFSLRWANSSRGFRTIVAGVLGALLVVFPYADIFRYRNGTFQRRPLSYLLVNKLDYDASVQMVNAIDFRAATGGTHGHQILGVLGFFVPRSVWPAKPGATGSLLTEFVGYRQSNVSSPLWVEAFVDGGVIAVVFAFLALGALATWAQRNLGRELGRPVDWQSLLMPILAAYSVIMLRGSLLSGVGALCVLTALTWLVTKKVANRTEQSPATWRGAKREVSATEESVRSPAGFGGPARQPRSRPTRAR